MGVATRAHARVHVRACARACVVVVVIVFVVAGLLLLLLLLPPLPRQGRRHRPPLGHTIESVLVRVQKQSKTTLFKFTTSTMLCDKLQIASY